MIVDTSIAPVGRTVPQAARARPANRYGDVDWGGAASTVLTSVVRGVSVRSTVLPPMEVDLQTPADPATSRMMAFLKPTLIFNTVAGPVMVAPYGEAQGLARDVLDWALYAGIGLAAWTGFSMWVGSRLAR